MSFFSLPVIAMMLTAAPPAAPSARSDRLEGAPTAQTVDGASHTGSKYRQHRRGPATKSSLHRSASRQSESSQPTTRRDSPPSVCTALGGGRYRLNDRDLLRRTDIMSVIGKQGRIVAYAENGVAKGAQVAKLRRRGLFGDCGVKTGDVILSVNGYPLTSLDEAFIAYAELQDARTFHVRVLRGKNKKPHTLSYVRPSTTTPAAARSR